MVGVSLSTNMPLYPFIQPDTGETQDIYFTMSEAPKIGTTVEFEGQMWKRELTTSQLAVAGLKPIDPFSAKQFVNKTGQMKNGTMGNLWDASKELSEKRAAKEGKDPVKEQYYRDYRTQRRGTPHLGQLAEQQRAAAKAANEKMKKMGISIELA